MAFGQAIKTCFRKYADFRGRARRSEYWFFHLFDILMLVVFFILYETLKNGLGAAAGGAILGLLALIWLATFAIPGLAVAVRRLHDTNSSGWWILLAAIPYVGGLIILVWYCIKGTAGENRFGPDPLNPHTIEAFD